MTISFIFPFLLIIAAICFSFCDGNSDVVCIESERDALLKFKNHLIDPSNRLSSWVEGEDCCQWTGVICNNVSGHVNQLHLPAHFSPLDEYTAPPAEMEAYFGTKLGGKISPSLLQLKHLTSLDLSHNNFSGRRIPEFLGELRSLTYLNLSHAQFLGAIPPNLGNLSRLQYLDLRGNDGLIEAKSLEWVSGLSSLQYLDLSFVDLHNATDSLQVTFKLPHLRELHLSGCNLEDDPSPKSSFNFSKSLAVLDLSWKSVSSIPMSIFSLHGIVSIDLSDNSLEGPIPDYFGNMSFLEVVDLSFNQFNSSIPNSLYGLKNLRFLSLQSNNFQGEISSAIGNLSSLIRLDLSGNKLQGRLPTSWEHLCKLEEMYLSSNEIDQDISEIIQSLSRCSWDCLESLSMSNNQLSGRLTDQLGGFKNLAYLSLAHNNISGPIPLSIGELSSLEFFDVSENQLSGTLPASLGKLANLDTLNFGQNQLEGVVSETHFLNLTRLTTFKASENMLRFGPNSSWVPPFRCETIELGGWNLGPRFPRWLKSQNNLSDLDISRARISDAMPSWFWNRSTRFEYLNLSSNQLTGGISFLNVTNTLDLSSNRFTGPLPKVCPEFTLILSNNSFSGSLSELVCNSSELIFTIILAIDTNRLSGEIPNCWGTWPDLVYINLARNNLAGNIPPSLRYTELQELNLRSNSLSGKLPSKLQHCTNLMILDLSGNHFSGSVPKWIGKKLSGLMVLRLRSNNFVGHIPHNICTLKSLQNLDLSNNNISGAIPKCFSHLTAMATKVNHVPAWGYGSGDISNPFYLKATLALKGREDEFSSTLGLVTSIDLSANNLTGKIPKELGTLIGLLSVNLSGNLLTGNIPDTIGNMESMESLDLSVNQLHGRIPWSFSKLNFLNHFNVSYNNLTGQIPTSTQLQSFENSSYVGNRLCGPPVSKSCSTKGDVTNNNGSSSSEESSEKSKVNGLYVSIILGFVMGFWGVVAPLFFFRSWRHAYYRKLDHVFDKLYVIWATMGK